MSHTKSTRQMMAGVSVAAGALLAAAAIPVATAPQASADDVTNAISDVALASSAVDVVDPGAAAFLDIGGFIDAEVADIEALISLPFVAAEDLLADLASLDIGAAVDTLVGAAEALIQLSVDIVLVDPLDFLL